MQIPITLLYAKRNGPEERETDDVELRRKTCLNNILSLSLGEEWPLAKKWRGRPLTAPWAHPREQVWRRGPGPRGAQLRRRGGRREQDSHLTAPSLLFSQLRSENEGGRYTTRSLQRKENAGLVILKRRASRADQRFHLNPGVTK